MSLPIGSLQHKVCTETRCFGINYYLCYMFIRIYLSKVFFRHINIYIHILPTHTYHQPPQPFVICAQMEASESFRDCGNSGVTFSVMDQVPWDDFQLENGPCWLHSKNARMKGNDVVVFGSDPDAWEKSRNHRLTNHETRCCYDHLLGELLLFLHHLPGGFEMMVYNPPFIVMFKGGHSSQATHQSLIEKEYHPPTQQGRSWLFFCWAQGRSYCWWLPHLMFTHKVGYLSHKVDHGG